MKTSVRKFLAAGLTLWCALALGAACPKQGPGVETGARSGGGTRVTGVSVPEANQVQINGSGLIDGTPFVISDPLRIVVDVKDVFAGQNLPSNVAGAGVIKDVEVKSLPDLNPPVVRVVVSVSQDVTYELKNRGMSLLLVLEPKANGEPVEGTREDANKLPYDETKKELERLLSGAPPPPMSPLPYSGGSGMPAQESSLLAHLPPPNFDGSATVVGDVFYRTTDDGLQILIVTNGAPARFSDYEERNPARLVVDFQGLTKGTSQWTYPVNYRGVSQVRIGQHPGMTRVVIDFRGKLPAYSVKKTASGVAVTIIKGAYMPGGVESQSYTTTSQESLRSVAQRVYNNPDAWTTILSANRDAFTRREIDEIRNSNGNSLVGSGLTLRVPTR